MSLIRPPRAMILDGDVPAPPEPAPDPTWPHAAPQPIPAHYGGMTTGLYNSYSTVQYPTPSPYGGFHGWVTSGD